MGEDSLGSCRFTLVWFCLWHGLDVSFDLMENSSGVRSGHFSHHVTGTERLPESDANSSNFIENENKTSPYFKCVSNQWRES